MHNDNKKKFKNIGTNTNLMIYYTYKTHCVPNGYQVDEIYTDLKKSFYAIVDQRILLISKLKIQGFMRHMSPCYHGLHLWKLLVCQKGNFIAEKN